jgi:hypothetical protein
MPSPNKALHRDAPPRVVACGALSTSFARRR